MDFSACSTNDAMDGYIIQMKSSKVTEFHLNSPIPELLLKFYSSWYEEIGYEAKFQSKEKALSRQVQKCGCNRFLNYLVPNPSMINHGNVKVLAKKPTSNFTQQ
jgi:hypothetical protein